MPPRRVNSVPYKKSTLEAALRAVEAGDFNMSKAAIAYGVPITTLSSHLRRRGYVKKKETINLAGVDREVIDWLDTMKKMNCFSLQNQLWQVANEVFRRRRLTGNLITEEESAQWADRFIKRHPELQSDLIQAEDSATSITGEYIDCWFKMLQEYLHESLNDVPSFFNDYNSSRIFCCFEIGSLHLTGNKNNSRLIYKQNLCKIDGKCLLTIYNTICANGSFLKPLILVKKEHAESTSVKNGNDDSHVLFSSDSVLQMDSIMLWIQLVDVELQEKAIKKPVVIYLDQGMRPLSPATLEFCKQREISLFYLPGHYPKMKLPIGMDIFYNLNNEYEKIIVSNDAKELEANSERAVKWVMEAWKNMLQENSCSTEFKDFGLMPLDNETMKSAVEAIIPVTMSSVKEVSQVASNFHTVGLTNNYHESSFVVPEITTDVLRESTHNSRKTPQTSNNSSGPKRESLHSESEVSKSDHIACDSEQLLVSKSSFPLVQFRNTRARSKNYRESSDSEVHSDGNEEKPCIKIRLKRSNRQNNYCVEKNIKQECFVPNVVQDCNQCDTARIRGIRSGVVQGLIFALKQVESFLCADTLNMFKARYLSQSIKDFHLAEPSFIIWYELMRCIECGPDAVHHDFLLTYKFKKSCHYHFEDDLPTNPDILKKNHGNKIISGVLKTEMESPECSINQMANSDLRVGCSGYGNSLEDNTYSFPVKVEPSQSSHCAFFPEYSGIPSQDKVVGLVSGSSHSDMIRHALKDPCSNSSIGFKLNSLVEGNYHSVSDMTSGIHSRQNAVVASNWGCTLYGREKIAELQRPLLNSCNNEVIVSDGVSQSYTSCIPSHEAQKHASFHQQSANFRPTSLIVDPLPNSYNPREYSENFASLSNQPAASCSLTSTPKPNYLNDVAVVSSCSQTHKYRTDQEPKVVDSMQASSKYPTSFYPHHNSATSDLIPSRFSNFSQNSFGSYNPFFPTTNGNNSFLPHDMSRYRTRNDLLSDCSSVLHFSRAPFPFTPSPEGFKRLYPTVPNYGGNSFVHSAAPTNSEKIYDQHFAFGSNECPLPPSGPSNFSSNRILPGDNDQKHSIIPSHLPPESGAHIPFQNSLALGSLSTQPLATGPHNDNP